MRGRVGMRGIERAQRAVDEQHQRHPSLPTPARLQPLETGPRILPVALCVAAVVRLGNKIVVTTGLLLLGAPYTWVSTASTTTGYGEINGDEGVSDWGCA